MRQMMQYIDNAETEADAQSVAGFLASQIDFVAGRILSPSDVYPRWRVQALFADCGHDMPLPEGCRRVAVPDSVLRQFTPRP